MVTCPSCGEEARVEATGGIDDAKVIENLVAIMEGGREAFRARKRRYRIDGPELGDITFLDLFLRTNNARPREGRQREPLGRLPRGILVVDVIARPVEGLSARGTLELVDEISMRGGGSALNTASALARLGLRGGAAFAAGLVYGKLARWPFEQAVRFASAVGALATTAVGASEDVRGLEETLALAGLE